MYLKKLTLINFKNIGELQMEFDRSINCLVGDNGAGKTNIVDAIHYLSMSKSSLSIGDNHLVRHGEAFFIAEGAYETDNGKVEGLTASYSSSKGKNFKRNGKEYQRIADHIGRFPLVIVSPSDSFLVSDSAEERRRYMNIFISQFDAEYLRAVIRYNQVVAERNKLLKDNSSAYDILEIYDAQLVQFATKIVAARVALVEALSPLVGEYYRQISGDREQVEISYESELLKMPFDDLLLKNRDRDRLNGFTSCGVHRDELLMKIGGELLKKYGSQGQQKSFIVALKLAQYSIVAQRCDEKPMLLLDDLFDKLDMSRVERLIGLVGGEEFGQIFITDCNKVRLESVLSNAGQEYSLFNISEGGVVR